MAGQDSASHDFHQGKTSLFSKEETGFRTEFSVFSFQCSESGKFMLKTEH